MTFGAFFDDTGTSPKQKIAGFAGYFAPVKEWEAFDAQWHLLLDDAKVPHFRAFDCVRRDGVFAAATGSECAKFYARALDIITGSKITGVAFAGRLSDFQTHAFHFERSGRVARGAYQFSVMQGMLHLAERLIRAWPKEKLSGGRGWESS